MKKSMTSAILVLKFSMCALAMEFPTVNAIVESPLTHSQQLILEQPEHLKPIDVRSFDLLTIPVQKELTARPAIVQQQGDKFVLDANFVDSTPTYATMADLSYHLAKGDHDRAMAEIDKLTAQGWVLKNFHGISGKAKTREAYLRALQQDLAGFVAFNSRTGEAVVVFHGSKDSADWENNLDAKVIDARANGYQFDGQIHQGFSFRYKSVQKAIYETLNSIYDGLSDAEKAKFFITVTGHSLGGAMTVVGFSDIATQWATQKWGVNYINAQENRVRGYAISAPRSLTETAVSYLEAIAGKHNIIIDSVDLDPVSKLGPGRTITNLLLKASSFGPTSWVLSVAKYFGLIETADPKEVAALYGNYRHLGYKAFEKASAVKERAKKLAEMDNAPKPGFFERIKNFLGDYFAPFHYGNRLPYGLAFDPRLLDKTTLEDRINGKYSVIV